MSGPKVKVEVRPPGRRPVHATFPRIFRVLSDVEDDTAYLPLEEAVMQTESMKLAEIALKTAEAFAKRRGYTDEERVELAGLLGEVLAARHEALADAIENEARSCAAQAKVHYANARYEEGGKADACSMRLQHLARRVRVATK